MATPSIKPKRASYFNAWKARVLIILEESDLDDLVSRVVEEPTTAQGREAFKKKQAKEKRVIFDSIKVQKNEICSQKPNLTEFSIVLSHFLW